MAAQSIFDLGALVKSKFPGAYDDLPDDEVGRRVKAKFPGSYDDFSDAPAAAARPLLPPSPLSKVQRPALNPDIMAPPSPEEITPPAMVAPPALPRSLGRDLPPAQPTPFNLPPQPIRRPMAPAGPIGPLPAVSGPTDFKEPELQNQPPAAPPVNVPPPSMLFPAMPIDATTGRPKVFTPPPPPGPEVSAARRAAESAGGPGPRSTPAIPPAQGNIPDWQSAYKLTTGNYPPFTDARSQQAPTSLEDLGIPPPEPGDVVGGFDRGLLSASLGFISPENIATTIATAGLGQAFSGLVNSAAGAELISKLPGDPQLIRKIADLASKFAVPAALAAKTGQQAGQDIYGVFTAATPAERATKASEAAVNLLMGAAQVWGLQRGVSEVAANHPPAMEAPASGGRILRSEVSYPGAPTKVPAPGVQEAAPQQAANLEQAGQRLAAKSWKELGDWGATSSKPFQVQAGDQTITFEPVGKGYVRAINQNGEVIRAASGSIEQAKSWLDQNVVRAKANPEAGGGISVGSGAAEAAEIQQVATATTPPGAPRSTAYDRAVKVAEANPSFGRNVIARELGVKGIEADAILDRLVADGIVKRAQNARGSVVYHRIPQAPPTAEQPAASTAPEAQPPTHPGPAPAPAAGEQDKSSVAGNSVANDLDAMLGDKDSIALKIGGAPHTLQRTTVQGKDGERKEYRVLDAEGNVVAGVRQATVETWLKKQAEKQEATTQVEKPSTPVEAPTAETKTVPETPETTSIQIDQLKAGQRRTVMIPEGTEAQRVPAGMRRTTVKGVGQFIFDPNAIGEKEIRAAVKENRLPEILGAAKGGLGAPDKSKLEGPSSVVVARSPEGTEVQSTVTDQANLPTALKQAEKLMPAGGKVEITSPEEVISERQGKTEITPGLKPDIEAPPAVEEPHKFSSTQVQIPDKFAARARDAAAAIPDSELAEDGRETEPHITVKYGLHDEEPSAVKKVLANEPPITATIGKVSIFPAKETDVQRGGDQYDVVKIDVDSPDLHRINKKIADATPHTDTHPTYQPHITLAYVKPGEGQKYVGKEVPGLTGQQVTFPAVRFSGKDRSTTDIPLTAVGKDSLPTESATTPQQAFRMSGKELAKLAESGDAVASAEIERRRSKSPAPIATKPEGAAITGTTEQPKAPDTGKATADSLRKAADGLEKQIYTKRNSGVSQQNPTARRNRIAAGMANEADRLERIQKGMRALADIHENGGDIHPLLAGIKSRSTFEAVMPRYDEQGKRVKAYFPTASMTSNDLNELLAKTKGLPGTADGRRVLERKQGQDIPRFSEDDIPAVGALMAVAAKRGWNDKYVGDRFDRPKRLYKLGIRDEHGLTTAQDAVEALGVKKREPTAEERISKAERELIGTKIIGYFPTPKPLARRVVESADISAGMSVLEPSAGNGNLADAVREIEPRAELDTIEWNNTLGEILKMKGHRLLPVQDFLTVGPREGEGWDRVVMNPPFENGQDIDHVRHAYELLKPGGRVVAIMSEGPFFRGDQKATAFREWLDSLGGISEKLPEASFTGKDSMRQTGVAVRLVEIDKPGGTTVPATAEALMTAEAPIETVAPAVPTSTGVNLAPTNLGAKVTPQVPPVRTPITRTIPKKGTPERDKITSEYDRLQRAIESQDPIVRDLRIQRDSAGYGTKRRETAEKKYDKESATLDALYAEMKPITRQSYIGRLEDAIESDNAILREAAALKLDEELKKPGTRNYDDVEKSITRQLEPIAKEAATRVEDGRSYLSGKQQEEAVHNAAVSTARNYLNFPLTAEEDIAKRMEGHVRGERLQIFRNQAQEQIDAIDKLIRDEGLLRSRVGNVRQMYDFDQIEKAVEVERKLLEDRKTEKKTLEEQRVRGSITMAKEAKLIDSVKATPRSKGAWEGNVVESGPFLSDGKAMIRTDAIPRPKSMAGTNKVVAKLSEKPKDAPLRSFPAKVVGDLWEKIVAKADSAEFAGTYDLDTKPFSVFVTSDETGIVVDAVKAAMIRSVTGSEEVAISKEKGGPLVFIKGGSAVAVLMPWRNHALPDIPTARATLIEQRAKVNSPDYREPLGPEAGVLRLGDIFSWSSAPANPSSKNQQRAIKRASLEADIPTAGLAKILKKDFGVDALDKLSQKQATALIGKLAEKMPNGVLLREPKAKPLDRAISSPSVVLTRSRAGSVIWRAASREYWRQKELVDRFSKNYSKAIAGTSREDRERIKLYRYVKQLLAVEDGGQERAELLLSAAGEDPAAVDTIDTNFLTPEQKEVNQRLTDWVFNPMWQRAVKEGLVPEDRYIDDYLTFYRSDLLQAKPRSRRDMAALLAAEEGMPLAVADKILAMANAKKATFGPFDFKRGKWSLPGTLPMDEVADIYIRGFARKSAHTAFLKVANKMRSKISNPYLRDYARMYINQYVGVPTHGVFDEWISQKIHENGLLKAVFGENVPGVDQIAMAATSLQYVSKIGLNMFTPIQNLTQIANTAAKAGAYRTAQGALTYVMARSLPNSINPWTRELVRLRQSGVLDSLSNKVERPHISGVKGKAVEALTFLFNQSEQMNRGASFYAGYFAAKAAGKAESEAIDDGRDLVRITQFFSGRLDAPLLSRLPVGRVFYQFKVFSLKTWETFWHQMSHTERLKWLLYSAAIGGPAALGVQSLMHTFMPDSPYTEKLDEWQETANLAAFLQVPRLAKAVGIWQFPAAEEASSEYRKWWENMARFVAGPTINAVFDTFHSALKTATADEADRTEQAWRLTWMLMRSWVPGGVSLRRLGQAMRDGQTTEAQLRIIFAAYDRDNPKDDGVIQKLAESLGVEKILPDLPEKVEVY